MSLCDFMRWTEKELMLVQECGVVYDADFFLTELKGIYRVIMFYA